MLQVLQHRLDRAHDEGRAVEGQGHGRAQGREGDGCHGLQELPEPARAGIDEVRAVPATAVGRANSRSTIASSTRLIGNGGARESGQRRSPSPDRAGSDECCTEAELQRCRRAGLGRDVPPASGQRPRPHEQACERDQHDQDEPGDSDPERQPEAWDGARPTPADRERDRRVPAGLSSLACRSGREPPSPMRALRLGPASGAVINGDEGQLGEARRSPPASPYSDCHGRWWCSPAERPGPRGCWGAAGRPRPALRRALDIDVAMDKRRRRPRPG